MALQQAQEVMLISWMYVGVKNRMLSGVEDEESVERATNAEQLKRGIILELFYPLPRVVVIGCKLDSFLLSTLETSTSRHTLCVRRREQAP